MENVCSFPLKGHFNSKLNRGLDTTNSFVRMNRCLERKKERKKVHLAVTLHLNSCRFVVSWNFACCKKLKTNHLENTVHTAHGSLPLSYLSFVVLLTILWSLWHTHGAVNRWLPPANKGALTTKKEKKNPTSDKSWVISSLCIQNI